MITKKRLIIEWGYSLLTALGNYLQPVLLLAFRLYWGWQFFQTGWGKLNNHPQVVEFFTSLGIPQPAFNAWFVGGVECFGGLLLLSGLGSRLIAFMLSVNMIVAYLSVADDRATVLNIFNDPEPFFSATPFLFLLASVLVFAFGPGVISIDHLIARWRKSSLNLSSDLSSEAASA